MAKIYVIEGTKEVLQKIQESNSDHEKGMKKMINIFL